MKRLVLVFAVLAALPVSAASGWPGVKAIAAERERVAGQEAKVLLRRFVVPPGAVRLARAPALPVNAWPVSEPAAKFASRARYWRTGQSLDAVAAFVHAHPPHGLTGQPSSNGPQFRILEFSWAQMRYLDVTLLRRADVTFLRVQADVVWLYPRSPREVVPRGVTEVDLKAPKVSRRVTDPAKVAQIVRWFDALPVTPPGVVLHCPLEVAPAITFQFRSASGALLATAKAPTAKSWICDSIEFWIGGHRQTALIDHTRGRGFVYRVQTLLGVKLLAKR